MINFTGSVSAQEKAGEVVTIVVIRPDGTAETVVTATKDDLTFDVTYPAVPGVGYSAMASIGEDALYLAATSNTVTFDVPKEPRTITLAVA